MKPLFFFILIFALVFTGFTSYAQLPLPGHDGYRKYYADNIRGLIEVVNKRNEFAEWDEGRDLSTWKYEGEIDSAGIMKFIFEKHKCFYNGRYYYSNYRDDGKYCYKIYLYDLYICLSVCSRYNDSEYIQCKHMLDKEARIVLRHSTYKYDAPE